MTDHAELLRLAERLELSGNPFHWEVAAALRQCAERERELEAMTEALTPSGDTKAAYIGEFGWNEEADDGTGTAFRVVPWTVIKGIMATIRERAAAQPTDTAPERAGGEG